MLPFHTLTHRKSLTYAKRINSSAIYTIAIAYVRPHFQTINMSSAYRGRFAPSPSGPLHFGSLIAAVGSFLHAKIHDGKWLVRIEDIDQTRVVANATDDILKTLDVFELHWDESVRYQTHHLSLYDEILNALSVNNQLYCCSCTRKMIKAMGGVYDKRCRSTPSTNSTENMALRYINDTSDKKFFDENLGWITPDERFVNDDVVLKRRDGLHAYQLVVVADDIAQNISHVVRGADLLDLTPVQKNLFSAISSLDFSHCTGDELTLFYSTLQKRVERQNTTPKFLHLPLAVTAPNQKLSKQNHARAINLAEKETTMHAALHFLGVPVPRDMEKAPITEQLHWAITNAESWRFRQQTEILYSEK